MAAYWWTVLGTGGGGAGAARAGGVAGGWAAGRGAGAAPTRRARAARVAVRASSMATDRKIRPSVRAPTVIWLLIIQWPSWAPNTWVGPKAKEIRAPPRGSQIRAYARTPHS